MMDEFISLLNCAVCTSLAIMCGYGIFSKHVNDGVIVKIALVFLSLGFAGYAWILHDGAELSDVIAMGRAQLLIHLGTVILFVGWRVRKPDQPITDFGLLDPPNVERTSD